VIVFHSWSKDLSAGNWSCGFHQDSLPRMPTSELDGFAESWLIGTNAFMRLSSHCQGHQDLVWGEWQSWTRTPQA